MKSWLTILFVAVLAISCSLIKVSNTTKDKTVLIHDTLVRHLAAVIDTFTQYHSDTITSEKIVYTAGKQLKGYIHDTIYAFKLREIHDTTVHWEVDATAIQEAQDSAQYFLEIVKQQAGASDWLDKANDEKREWIWRLLAIIVISVGLNAYLIYLILKKDKK